MTDPTTAAAQRLDNAILSFAHRVDSDLPEILDALRTAGQRELADDLVTLNNAWRDASQEAWEAIRDTLRTSSVAF